MVLSKMIIYGNVFGNIMIMDIIKPITDTLNMKFLVGNTLEYKAVRNSFWFFLEYKY